MPAVQADTDGDLFADVQPNARVLLAYDSHDGAGLFHVLDDATDDITLRAVSTGAEIVVDTDTGEAFTAGDGRDGRLGVVAGTVPVHAVEQEMYCRRCADGLEWYVVERRRDGSPQYVCADCAQDHLDLGGESA